MGTYNVNQMGRYVEIYYGSFRRKYPDAPPEKCARELVRTLKHELTHHIESLAMDRSLEKWDEQHVAELLAGLDDEPSRWRWQHPLRRRGRRRPGRDGPRHV